MPTWLGEEFLSSLIVFLKNHIGWAVVEELLEKSIAKRLADKKIKKVLCLTS